MEYFMDYQPLASNGGVKLHAGRPPIVVMEHRAALRMRAFTMMSPIEVAGFGLLAHQCGNNGNGPDRLVIADVHVMQQDCTMGSADITPQGFFGLQDRLEKKYGRIVDKEMRVWWHSHGRIGVGWSVTDTGTMNEYTSDVELLCLLTNHAAADLNQDLFADKTLACYISGPPARIGWNGLFIGVEKPNEGESDQAILEEAIQDFNGAIRNLPAGSTAKAEGGKLIVTHAPQQPEVKPAPEAPAPTPQKEEAKGTPKTKGDEEVTA